MTGTDCREWDGESCPECARLSRRIRLLNNLLTFGAQLDKVTFHRDVHRTEQVR